MWYSKGTFKYTFETQSMLATYQAIILNSVTFKDVCKHTCRFYSNIENYALFAQGTMWFNKTLGQSLKNTKCAELFLQVDFPDLNDQIAWT